MDLNTNNTYTVTTSRNIFQRSGKSLTNILVGLLLFIFAIGLLFWNEGRHNPADTLRKSVESSQSSVGELVYVEGQVEGSPIAESIQNLNLETREDIVGLRRSVEVYAWVESSSSSSDVKLGGTEETTTTYSYEKKWVSDAPSASSFTDPRGYTNIPKSILDAEYYANEAQIEGYSVDFSKMKNKGWSDVGLNVFKTLPDSVKTVGNYLYFGDKLDVPEVGDMRVSYQVLPEGRYTVFGKNNSDNIGAYYDKKDRKTYAAYYNQNRQEAIISAKIEYKVSKWLVRLLGFILMWVALTMVVSIVPTLASVIPFFGKLTGGALSAVAFVVALVLSVITIGVSIVLHNIWLLAGVLFTLALITYLIINNKRNNEK